MRVNERGRALAEEVANRRRLEHEMVETSEREQRRIGRDLHDGLCQHLTATAVSIFALSRDLEAVGSIQVEKARKAVELVEQGISMARTITQGLHPIEMRGDGLMQALEEFAETTSDLFDVKCRFECCSPIMVDAPSTAAHLYRIVQEGVNNAIRHGSATEIEVSLEETETDLQLTVSDNGKGLPSQTSERRGLGLEIMAARAKLIGGNFTMGRSQKGGVELTCLIPGFAYVAG